MCVCVCVCVARHFNDDPADLPMNMTRHDDDFLYPESFEMEEKKDEVPITLWMREYKEGGFCGW